MHFYVCNMHANDGIHEQYEINEQRYIYFSPAALPGIMPNSSHQHTTLDIQVFDSAFLSLSLFPMHKSPTRTNLPHLCEPQSVFTTVER